MERRILGNVQAAVAPIVSAPVMVAVDGHTTTITGPVADAAERDALLAAIDETPGVRTVVDELVVPTAGPDLSAGPAPNADIEPFIDADAPPTPDDLSQPPASEPDDPALPPEPTDQDVAPLSAAGPEASDPASAAQPPGPAQDPGAALAERPANDAGPLPSLLLTLENRALTLEGRMNADEDLTALIQPALAAFDPSYLTNRIDTSEAAAPADWLASVAALLPDLAELADPRIEITDRQITLSGIAATREQHDRIIETALDAFDDYALVERIEVGSGASAPAAGLLDLQPDAQPDLPPETSVAGRVEPSAVPLPADTASAGETADAEGSLAALEQAFAALGGQRLLFESSSDTLVAGSETRLDALAALFARYPDVRIEIEGHTDASGPASANLTLSQKRATAVLSALVARDVARGRLVAYGYGEGVPLVDNSTPEGRARNRRIEFRFQ